MRRSETSECEKISCHSDGRACVTLCVSYQKMLCLSSFLGTTTRDRRRLARVHVNPTVVLGRARDFGPRRLPQFQQMGADVLVDPIAREEYRKPFCEGLRGHHAEDIAGVQERRGARLRILLAEAPILEEGSVQRRLCLFGAESKLPEPVGLCGGEPVGCRCESAEGGAEIMKVQRVLHDVELEAVKGEGPVDHPGQERMFFRGGQCGLGGRPNVIKEHPAGSRKLVPSKKHNYPKSLEFKFAWYQKSQRHLLYKEFTAAGVKAFHLFLWNDVHMERFHGGVAHIKFLLVHQTLPCLALNNLFLCSREHNK